MLRFMRWTNDNDFIDTTPIGFSDRKSDKELMKDTDTGPDIIKPKGSHSCNLCEKNYTSKIQLEIHMRSHSGEKPFACDLCPSKFARRDVLKVHQTTHADQGAFSCDKCEKKYKCKVSLQTHKRKHMGERPFVCTICGQSFRGKK